MDERDSLLNAVIEASNRDTIRLVFADWLDENGECGESMRWAWRKGKKPFSAGFSYGCFWFADISSMNFRTWVDYYCNLENLAPVIGKSFVGKNFPNNDIASQIGEFEFKNQSEAWNWFIKRFGELHNQGKIGYSRPSKKKLVVQEANINDTHQTD